MLLNSREKYKTLFETHYNALCNYALRFVPQAETCEDIVQEVFVHLWQKRNELGEISNEKAYLYQATRNKAIEIIRRDKLAMKYEESQKAISEVSYEIDQDVEQSTRKEKLFVSIRQLPPKCRQIFEMSKMNGLTYREIAEELDLSVKTVENQVGRALKLLREMIKS